MDDELASRGRPCGQAGSLGTRGQGRWDGPAPPLLWRPFDHPGPGLISALGQVLPERQVLGGRALSWEPVKGLVQVQDDLKKYSEKVPASLCQL